MIMPSKLIQMKIWHILIKARYLKIFQKKKGVALKFLGKFDEAIIMYNHVLKIDPNEFIAYINKGKRLKLF